MLMDKNSEVRCMKYKRELSIKKSDKLNLEHKETRIENIHMI